ncbi:MAG: hypothetical protein ACREM2_06820 [Vulcanimicrobiaceae bacterium]
MHLFLRLVLVCTIVLLGLALLAVVLKLLVAGIVLAALAFGVLVAVNFVRALVRRDSRGPALRP